MKAASSYLFELIKSLSREEQRNFKKYCLQMNNDALDSDYYQLFQAYLNQVEFNEEEIKEKHHFRHFKRIKNYLRNLLMDFLRQNVLQKPEDEIMEHLKTAELLISRTLYQPALELLHRTRKIAEEKEFVSLLIWIDETIFFAMQFVLNPHEQLKHYEQYENTVFPALTESLRKSLEIKRYMALRAGFNHTNFALMRSKEAKKNLEDTFLPLIQKRENYKYGFRNRYFYFLLCAWYHNQKDDYASAEEYFRKTVELSREYQHLNVRDFYQTALNNLLFTYSHSRNFEKMDEVFAELKAIVPETPLEEFNIKATEVRFRLYYFQFFHAKVERTEFLVQAEQFISANEEKVGIQKLFFMLNFLSVNYFADKEFKKALSLINLLNNYESTQLMRTYMLVIKIYRLIIYYELDKTELIPYALRSIYRQVTASGQNYRFEKITAALFKSLINAHTKKEQHQVFMSFYPQLLELKKDEFENKVFYLFNFSGWIKCKVEQRKYHDLMSAD